MQTSFVQFEVVPLHLNQSFMMRTVTAGCCQHRAIAVFEAQLHLASAGWTIPLFCMLFFLLFFFVIFYFLNLNVWEHNFVVCTEATKPPPTFAIAKQARLTQQLWRRNCWANFPSIISCSHYRCMIVFQLRQVNWWLSRVRVYFLLGTFPQHETKKKSDFKLIALGQYMPIVACGLGNCFMRPKSYTCDWGREGSKSRDSFPKLKTRPPKGSQK